LSIYICAGVDHEGTSQRGECPVGVCDNVVVISNCVIVKWGGAQLEAKGQSEETALSLVVRDNESDSAGQAGESRPNLRAGG